ncbi:hypothetical protein GIY62_14625 [Burkholderia plantarii]|uniref:hypothetical protein n=1 Tax=Burkholderia plantarii TaxID=41899 RepID=UPI00272DA73F|nr:hypothetical protein [Burkholderia plantarii]WLE58361.1 hypothetical protein GIY62_14625 [Burkholderia plantarii]
MAEIIQTKSPTTTLADSSAFFMQAKYLFSAIAESGDLDQMIALAQIGERLMREAELNANNAVMAFRKEARHD